MKQNYRGLLALSPIVVLLGVYLVGSLLVGDFYAMPIGTAFVVAAIYGVAITTGRPLQERIHIFSEGASHRDIIYMIWIFCLAGIFATSAKSMGAVDATVGLTLHFVPSEFLPAGIFLAACFISMSVGTSVGTIVALTPVVNGLAAQLGCDTAWFVAIVVGGAFFGDNLSFISDTTIAATQTQGCRMKDKFRTNFILVLPAALITLGIYLFGSEVDVTQVASSSIGEWYKALPYLLVIVLALTGMNVLVVLLLGTLLTIVMGLICGSFTLVGVATLAGEGLASMYELILVTMLAGGVMALVKVGGGFDFLIRMLTRGVSGKRGAEAVIALLTALTNLCTANNTIAILTVGPIARDLSLRYNVPPRRSASLMDTASCFVQGIIPYGAQLLMASGLAEVSPVAIIPHLYYPILLGVMVVLSILWGDRSLRCTCLGRNRR
ncbi:MAG: Na+/H+ antiporter NhaC family protein [Alistipes sp.]|nr:Na+/H+ antiporter NhaC family protein [Alistipes sp.]